MKKHMIFFLTVLFCLGAVAAQPVLAEEMEVLRGEEEEREIFLDGSEEVYSVFGELESDGAYILLKNAEENPVNYQAMETAGDGHSAAVPHRNWRLRSAAEAEGRGAAYRNRHHPSVRITADG